MSEQQSRTFAPPPLEGSDLVLGTISVSLATFMIVLDSSIANVSIPAIAGDLGVSPNQGTWVITSFGVANGISVPLTGWLTQRLGTVRLFTLSTLLFVLASFLCGMAPTLESLVFFRVLQGLFAGPMIPLSQALLLQAYPPKKAGMALAMWSMTTLVAPVMGPLLGGWLTDNLSWSWIFYINVPVGLGAAALTWSIYRTRETPTHKLPIDTVGLVAIVIWVGALQIMLDKGKELDWFASTEIVILALIALVGFIFFLIWELSEEHPVVDLSLFKRPNFAIGCVVLSFGYGTVFGNIVLVPLWLQQFMGYTATWAGMIMAPVGLLAIILMPLVGKTVNRVDPRIMVTISFLVFVVVLMMRSGFNTQADLMTLLTPTLIQGIAMALFFVPLMTLIMAGIAPARIPAASGLSNFARITAGAFGTSIATTTWDERAAFHHARLVEAVDPSRGPVGSAYANLQSLGLSAEQQAVYVNRLIDQQAYTMGANEIFFVSAMIFVVLSAIVWLMRPATFGVHPDSGGAH